VSLRLRLYDIGAGCIRLGPGLKRSLCRSYVRQRTDAIGADWHHFVVRR
jgi:hypothetical protein